MSDQNVWTAHIKYSPVRYEISVCYGQPDISWGWFGRVKIQIEGERTIDEGKVMAERIAAALNAAGYDPRPGT